jgi:hypothetical protein
VKYVPQSSGHGSENASVKARSGSDGKPGIEIGSEKVRSNDGKLQRDGIGSPQGETNTVVETAPGCGPCATAPSGGTGIVADPMYVFPAM